MIVPKNRLSGMLRLGCSISPAINVTLFHASLANNEPTNPAPKAATPPLLRHRSYRFRCPAPHEDPPTHRAPATACIVILSDARSPRRWLFFESEIHRHFDRSGSRICEPRSGEIRFSTSTSTQTTPRRCLCRFPPLLSSRRDLLFFAIFPQGADAPHLDSEMWVSAGCLGDFIRCASSCYEVATAPEPSCRSPS